MSKSHEACSPFFNTLSPEGAGTNEVRPADNELNFSQDDLIEADVRRDWLRQHGDIIIPDICQRSHCGRRRPRGGRRLSRRIRYLHGLRLSSSLDVLSNHPMPLSLPLQRRQLPTSYTTGSNDHLRLESRTPRYR